MEKLLTTAEVYTMDGSCKTLALRWARKNKVRMFSRDYMWSEAEAKAYTERNHRRGRPKA